MLAKKIQNLQKFLDDQRYEYQKPVLENIFELMDKYLGLADL